MLIVPFVRESTGYSSESKLVMKEANTVLFLPSAYKPAEDSQTYENLLKFVILCMFYDA